MELFELIIIFLSLKNSQSNVLNPLVCSINWLHFRTLTSPIISFECGPEQYVKKLLIEKNSFDFIDHYAFRGLNQIKQLSLKDNRLKQLDRELFLGLKDLEHLNLQNIQLEIIHRKQFNGLINLKTLNLANNRLLFLNSDLFKDLHLLENLDLFNNAISIIGLNFVNVLNRLNLLEFKFGNNSCSMVLKQENFFLRIEYRLFM